MGQTIPRMPPIAEIFDGKTPGGAYFILEDEEPKDVQPQIHNDEIIRGIVREPLPSEREGRV